MLDLERMEVILENLEKSVNDFDGIAKAQIEIEEAYKAIEKARKEISDGQKLFKENVDAQNILLNKNEEKLESLQVKVETLEAEKVRIDEILDELKFKFETLEAEKVRIVEMIDDHDKKLFKHEKSISEIKKELNDFRLEINNHAQELEKLNKNSEEHLSEINQLKEKNIVLKNWLISTIIGVGISFILGLIGCFI